jgi:hypothetical protein
VGIKPRILGHQPRSDNKDYATPFPLTHSDNGVLYRVLYDLYISYIYTVQLSIVQ